MTAPAIDVWCLSLAAPSATSVLLARLLSPRERLQAERFAFVRDRHRYVIAHGALRSILSRYARVPARELRIESAAGGKPRLASPGQLRFNLSHSGDRALVAVSWQREVGVDIEAVRPLDDLDALAASCFSAAERRELADVPDALRLDAFYDAWTRKEAFLKLLGDGLSRPLDSFDVTVSPGRPARLLRVAGGHAERWVMDSLDAGPGYRAALASEGPPASVRLEHWTAAATPLAAGA